VEHEAHCVGRESPTNRDRPNILCGCGLAEGRLTNRQGVLCRQVNGDFYISAPRRADVALAERVVAAVAAAGDDRAAELVADLKGVGAK